MTPWYQKTAKEQLPLVMKASKGNYSELEKEVIPMIEKIALHYVDEERLDEATAAGLEALPSAVKSYIEQSLPEGKDYKFSTYYSAWVKWSIEAWLREEG